MVLEPGFQMFGKTRLYVSNAYGRPTGGSMTLERIKGVSKGRALSRKDPSIKFHFSRDDGQTTWFSIVYPDGKERFFFVGFELRQTDMTIDPWTEYVRITREHNGNFMVADEELSKHFERVVSDFDCYEVHGASPDRYLDNPEFEGYFTKEAIKEMRSLKRQDDEMSAAVRKYGSEYVCWGT